MPHDRADTPCIAEGGDLYAFELPVVAHVAESGLVSDHEAPELGPSAKHGSFLNAALADEVGQKELVHSGRQLQASHPQWKRWPIFKCQTCLDTWSLGAMAAGDASDWPMFPDYLRRLHLSCGITTPKTKLSCCDKDRALR